MVDAEHQLVIAGMPGAGKTSFLALLWLALSDGRSAGLELAHYQDDRAYLVDISKQLQRCRELKHTEVGEDRDLHLSLLVGDGRTPATLRIPDLSGETWEDGVTLRQWPASLDAQIAEATGLLLFVHSRNLHAPASKAQVAALATALDTDDATPPAPDVQTAPRRDPHPNPSRTNSKPPTQVAVTDILQLVCEQRGGRPCRAAIVFSAWDLVDNDTSPGSFLEQNLPLVHQYVSSHSRWLQVATFGVSAQGGRFDNEQRDSLLDEDPVGRAKIVDADNQPVTVESIPLWVLDPPPV